jgi:hypothetical protein
LQTLGDGNQISRKEQTTVYRDSQGRIRTEETVTPPAASGKAAHTVVTIFDPVAGSEFRLDSSTMTARQAGIPKFARAGAAAGAADSQARAQRESAGRPAGSGRPNVTTTDLGTQVINGVSARGTQYTETIPAGAIGNAQAMQVVRITWISTELKVPVEIKSSDPRFGSTDMELTNIAQTEPSASLFVVPAGYTIQQGGRGSDGPRAAGRRGPPLQ